MVMVMTWLGMQRDIGGEVQVVLMKAMKGDVADAARKCVATDKEDTSTTTMRT